MKHIHSSVNNNVIVRFHFLFKITLANLSASSNFFVAISLHYSMSEMNNVNTTDGQNYGNRTDIVINQNTLFNKLIAALMQQFNCTFTSTAVNVLQHVVSLFHMLVCS